MPENRIVVLYADMWDEGKFAYLGSEVALVCNGEIIVSTPWYRDAHTDIDSSACRLSRALGVESVEVRVSMRGPTMDYETHPEGWTWKDALGAAGIEGFEAQNGADLSRANEVGDTLAHMAARNWFLPNGFNQWAMANWMGWTVAHEAAKERNLPEGFDQWAMTTNSGWSVAHEAAWRGYMPDGFDRWELADEHGRTVAHAAAEQGHLPRDFSQWTLADESGWSVAHVAATYGHLPEDFDQWELADFHGKTVRDVAVEHGHVPDTFRTGPKM